MLRNQRDHWKEAEALARLMACRGLTQEQAALRVGMSQSAVANKLRILKHPAPVRDALREAGFRDVTDLKRWGATHCIRAVK